MSLPSKYELSIETILPEKVVEGEIFRFIYRVRNISKVPFPGGVIYVHMWWPNIGSSMVVNHPIPVSQLQPNEALEFSREEKPATSGMTIFTRPKKIPNASDGVPMELYLVDGRKLAVGQLIGGVRARSREEISQGQAVYVAAISLLFLVVFQIIDWLLGLPSTQDGGTSFESLLLIIAGVLIGLLCCVVAHLVRTGFPRRPKRMAQEGPSPPAEPFGNEFQRTDRLFDIGALLVTVLSAAILQYVSVKRFDEVNFAFRVLTIPIIILIILWLVKDLFPHLFVRLFIRQFCWIFFGLVLSTDILLFQIATFFLTVPEAASFLVALIVPSYLFSLWIFSRYKRASPEIVLFGSRRITLAFDVAQQVALTFLAYILLLWIIAVSNLPGP